MPAQGPGWRAATGTDLTVAVACQLGDEAHVVVTDLGHLLADVVLGAAAGRCAGPPGGEVQTCHPQGARLGQPGTHRTATHCGGGGALREEPATGPTSRSRGSAPPPLICVGKVMRTSPSLRSYFLRDRERQLTEDPDTSLPAQADASLLLLCESVSYSRKQGSRTREQNSS